MLTRTAKLQKGERILVHGASGGVGTALIELGRRLHLEMYGTCSEAKSQVVRDLGATPIDYRSENFEEIIGKLPDPGVDAVFDALGGDHFGRSYKCLRKGGRFVAYGSQNASVISTGLAFAKIKMSFLDGRGEASFYRINAVRKDHLDWFREDLQVLSRLLRKKKIRPIVADVLPLEKVAEATSRLESGKVSGMIVLAVNSD